MKLSKIIAAFLAATMMTVSAVPTVTTAETSVRTGAILVEPVEDDPSADTIKYPQNAKEYQILSEAYPDGFRVDEDSVYFMTWYDSDIVTSTNSRFHLQRQEGYENYGFIFTPEEDGTFVVSVVQMMEQIFDIDVVFDIVDDPGLGIDDPVVPEPHFHYFYPRIKNYVVTVKNGEISAKFKGEKEYLDEDTIDALISEGWLCYYVEMDTDDIFENSDYYSFASGNLGSHFFAYFDYAYGTDRSEFFMLTQYGTEYFDVSGSGKIAKSGNCSGYLDGYFLEGTCDEWDYHIVSPTKDGMVEIETYSLYGMGISYFLTVQNGQFVPVITLLDDLRLGMYDVNLDGSIGIADAVVLQKHLLTATDLTKTQSNCADTNHDDKVDIFDLINMKQAVLLDHYPVEYGYIS